MNNSNLARRGLWALLLLGCCAAFGFQGSRGIWAPDEGFYAVIAKQMLHERSFLVPQLNDKIWLDKPPLAMWGMAAGMALLGQNEWGARLSHALLYVATLGLIYLLGCAMAGRRGGLLAGLFYLLMAFPLVGANVVTPDSPLTFWTTLALFCFWQSARPDAQHAALWKLAMCAALGFGFLTKGPAALIPTAAWFVYLLFQRRALRYFICWIAPLCIILFASIGLSWYIFIARKVPGALEYIIDNQLIGRTVSAKYGRNSDWHDAVLYLPVLLLGTLPGAFIIWYGAWKNRRQLGAAQWWRAQLGEPRISFLLLSCAIPALLLALASSKLPLYILPVFPPLACLFAICFDRTFPATQPAAQPDGIPPGIWKMACVCVVLMLGVKVVSAHLPSKKNMRHLSRALQEHLPAQDYEIVSVDEELDGLAFYDIQNIETSTLDDEPYPFFESTEHVSIQVAGMKSADHYHLYLGSRSRRSKPLKQMLDEAGVKPTEIELPHNRWLLLCPPGTNPEDIVFGGASAIGASTHSRFAASIPHPTQEY